MKKGFTLVEVMVVIVILGVLSAVGVPKLFGVIAKAKASEAPVAAGTYISLQDAYINEGIAIGTWQDIGYEPPSSQVFSYEPVCVTGSVSIEVFSEAIIGWRATNIVNLNNCSKGGGWAISMTPGSGNKPTYNHVVSSTDCGALTFGWNVGQMQSGACPTLKVPEAKSSSSSAEVIETVEETSSASNGNACNNGVGSGAVNGACGNGQLKKSSSSTAPASSATVSDKCNNGVGSGSVNGECGQGQLKKMSSSSAANNGTTIISTSSASQSGSTGTNTGSTTGSTGGSTGGGSENSNITIPGTPTTHSGSTTGSTTGGTTSNTTTEESQPVTITTTQGNLIDINSLDENVCIEYNGKSSNCRTTIAREKCTEYDTDKKLCTEYEQ